MTPAASFFASRDRKNDLQPVVYMSCDILVFDNIPSHEGHVCAVPICLQIIQVVEVVLPP